MKGEIPSHVRQLWTSPGTSPDSDWHVWAVMPKGHRRFRKQWVAILFRVKGGIHETMWPDLGKHETEGEAWDYAKRVASPTSTNSRQRLPTQRGARS